MADKITKIGSSYDMVSIMREIGANYFGSDLSEQRIGMFGYLTESAANMFGAAILDASNRQQEYNTCTAKKRSTLLYDGAKLDINIDNATPNKMTAYVGVLTNNITNPSHKGGFGTPISGTNKNNPDYLLVIEKDAVINIANYDFMFEHDIQIKASYNQVTKSYSYSVRYLFEGDVDKTSLTGEYTIPRYNTAYDADDKYIQSYVQNYSKDISILLFKIDLVQISKESTIYSIVKNDIVSLTGLDFPFSNELSHFNIFYRKNGTSGWQNILPVPIYQSDNMYTEDVIFYETLHDEKKIRLTMSDFVPAYNSEIRVDIYNTMGSEVNDLIYSGDGSDITITLNTLDERHSYTGLELNCNPISSAYGGSDTPTLEELRTKVITAKSSVNSIDTNYDLINFMKSRDDTNDCIFVKKRNDIIERRYSCFMIPRLIKKDIIPTSTLDLCVPNFDSTIDTENHTYYEFIQANNTETYTDPLFYSISDESFVGSRYNIDNKGESDKGVDFYSINESPYTYNSPRHLSDTLIAKSYNQYSIGSNSYTKAKQYVSLEKYFNDEGISYDKYKTLLDDVKSLSFKNPIENISSVTKYKLKYSNTKLSQNSLYYDLLSRRFVTETSLDKDSNDLNLILNKYKLRGKIYNREINEAGLYLADNDDNPSYYYNPLKTYNTSDLFFAVSDINGKYVMSNGKYYDDSTSEADRYSIISITSTDYSLSYDLDKSDIVNYNTSEACLLIKTIENGYTIYVSPYSNRRRYSFIDMNIDNNNDPMLVDQSYTTNESYYYNIPKMASKESIYNKNGMFIRLNDCVNGYSDSELNEYMRSEMSTYYTTTLDTETTVDGLFIFMCTNDMNNKDISYYYKYLDNVTIKDIPLYTAMSHKEIGYNRVIENKYLYYITDVDSEDSNNVYTHRKLYYRITKNSHDDIGSYIYDADNKIYIKQIDDYTIDGIIFSMDSNKNKVNLTIKSGTPLVLKKDIANNKSVSLDTSFDKTKPSYRYPITSIDEFYTKNNYSDEGVKFNTNNSLMILNMNETITNSNGEIIDKYVIDQNRGLYWAKDGASLENTMKVFSLPYTIVYNVQNQIASFFLTSISRDVNMNMVEEEVNTTVNFSIDTIHIERNSSLEDESAYNISVTIMTNGDISNAKLAKEIDSGTITESNIGQTAGTIMLKGFIYDNSNTLVGYFDFDHDTTVSNSTEDMFTFKGKIKIDDSISSTYFTAMKNMYSIKGLECDINNESSFTYHETEYWLPDNVNYEDKFLNLRIENLKIGIGCYYLDRSIKMDDIISIDTSEMEIKPIISNTYNKDIMVSTVGHGILSYPQFAVKLKYETTEGPKEVIDKYILTNVYDNSIDLINIYTDMSNFVKSSVQIHEIVEDGKTIEMIHFTDIPVLQFSQSLSDAISDRITNVIYDTNENLMDLSNRITNSFSIDYKFFRTYGPCRYFKLKSLNSDKTSKNDEGKSLGNLDIKIKFSLLIKQNLSISDNEVVSQLKSYIKTRIEELNNETNEDDYTIYISNIITDIENEFNDYVRSIELVSINDDIDPEFNSSYRIIEYNKPNFDDVEYYNSTNSNDIKEYIPEYINVPLNNITIDIRR